MAEVPGRPAGTQGNELFMLAANADMVASYGASIVVPRAFEVFSGTSGAKLGFGTFDNKFGGHNLVDKYYPKSCERARIFPMKKYAEYQDDFEKEKLLIEGGITPPSSPVCDSACEFGSRFALTQDTKGVFEDPKPPSSSHMSYTRACKGKLMAGFLAEFETEEVLAMSAFDSDTTTDPDYFP